MIDPKHCLLLFLALAAPAGADEHLAQPSPTPNTEASDPWKDVNGQAPVVVVPIPFFDESKPETWEKEWSWFQRFGATQSMSSRVSNEEHRLYSERGIETVTMPHTPARNASQPAEGDLWITTYLKSPWQTKPAEGAGPAFSIDIPQDPNAHPEAWNYRFDESVPLEVSLHVQEKSSRELLSRDEWTYDPRSKTVTVTGGKAGESYRALFLCGEKFSDKPQMNVDGIPPAGRREHMEFLGSRLDQLPDLDVVRPTTFCYLFSIIRPFKGLEPPYPATPSYSWSGYQRTTTHDRLKRFEERHGKPFDIRTMTDTCYMEEGYPPTEETWQWINLVREDLKGYVKDYVAAARERGKRVRMFWGDQWIGVEPYLGDVDAGGIDEITTALHGPPGRVRDLMSFPGKAKRFVRFTKLPGGNMPPQQHAARARAMWRQWKAEMLVECPDGIEFLVMPEKWLKSGPVANAYTSIAEDFKKVFHETHGRERHKPITIVVLNAWGGMRGLGRIDYPSRSFFNNMVNWSADLRFERFEEVVANGVPDDADLVILYGEPDTAWSGGGIWKNPKLAEAIRVYVENGGGLLCLGGGAGFVEGDFKLADLLGVKYAGAPTEYAAAGLWNANRWNEAGEPVDAFSPDKVMPVRAFTIDPGALPKEVAARCDTRDFDLRIDCLVKATDGTVFATADDGSDACTLARPGKGRTAYLPGYGASPRLFKVLGYYLAGKLDELDRLDTGDAGVLPFFYPKGNRLVLLNTGGETTVNLRFDPSLAGLDKAERIALTPTDGGKAIVVDAKTLREGWPVELPSHETVYWKVSAAENR